MESEEAFLIHARGPKQSTSGQKYSATKTMKAQIILAKAHILVNIQALHNTSITFKVIDVPPILLVQKTHDDVKISCTTFTNKNATLHMKNISKVSLCQVIPAKTYNQTGINPTWDHIFCSIVCCREEKQLIHKQKNIKEKYDIPYFGICTFECLFSVFAVNEVSAFQLIWKSCNCGTLCATGWQDRYTTISLSGFQ